MLMYTRKILKCCMMPGLLRALSVDIKDLYELVKKMSMREEWGLTLKIESGMGVFY